MTAPETLRASPRATRVGAAILLAVAVAVVIAALGGEGSRTVAGGRLGGDFPEFYGAGRIVREGDADELYDAHRQARSQEGLFGGDETGYLDFAYPPVVAAVYAPLSLVPYRIAYVIHVGVMTALLWLALWLVRPMVPVVRDNAVLALAGAVAFFPMFRALGGGQNTALTVLCLVGAWRARHDDRGFVSGLWIGAMLFKPQLAVIVLLAQLASRRWAAIAGAAVSGAVLWIASAATMGTGWIGPFLRHGAAVPSGDGRVGGGGSVSLIGTAHRFEGVAEDVLVPLAIACSILVAAVCIAAWRKVESIGPAGTALGFALLGAGTVLASPHVIFYDAGLLLVVGLYALRTMTPDLITRIALVTAVSWLGAFDSLPVNPLFVLVVGALVWVLRREAAPDRDLLWRSAPQGRVVAP